MVLTSGHTLSSILLKPIYSAFAEVGHMRVRHFMSDSISLDVPVISVGNLTFGGTSKTPVAGNIATALHDLGFSPGIVLRGYRGKIDRENSPPRIVSDGSGIFLNWHESGDEARQVAEKFLGNKISVPVSVGRDRSRASELLINQCGVDIIILDDGYQYTRLNRDIDLVLVDAISPFGNIGLNVGPVREPLTALNRADAVLITHTEAAGPDRLKKITDIIENSTGKNPPIFNSRTIVTGIRNFSDKSTVPAHKLESTTYIGFAGIGNRRSYQFTLGTLPGSFAGFMGFPDHHPYDLNDIRRISKKASDKNACIVLTTSKDAVRLAEFSDQIDFDLRVVEIDVEIDRRSEFFDFVTGKLVPPLLTSRHAC